MLKIVRKEDSGLKQTTSHNIFQLPEFLSAALYFQNVQPFQRLTGYIGYTTVGVV